MRILLVSHYTLPHYGGIEVVVENLAKGFARQGHAVRVLSSRTRPTQEPIYERRHGFEIFRVPAWNGLERYAVPYPVLGPRLLMETRQLVRWADIVHAHGFLYQTTITALCIARQFRRPAILTEYAGFVHYRNPLWNGLQILAIHTLGRFAIAMSDRLVTVGERALGLLQKLAGPGKTIHLIQTGVDIERFCPPNSARKEECRRRLGWDHRPKVLFVGRLVPRKGIDLLLQVLDARYDLVICGRGDLPLPRCPHLLVYRSPDDETLLMIYQAADLFVLPSHSEGAFPLTAQEAMACGLPVIAVFDPVYRTYVTEEVVEFIPPSPEALRNAILNLIAHPGRWEERSARSWEWARTHFSWERCVEQHLALYQLLTGGASDA